MGNFIKEKPVIIEFVGLPGAGKTTIAKKICKLLSEESFLCVCPDSLRRDTNKLYFKTIKIYSDVNDFSFDYKAF